MNVRTLFAGAVAGAAILAASNVVVSQPKPASDDIRELKLRDWEPRSMMVTKEHRIEKPMYPVVDIHNHLGGGKDRLTAQTVARYLSEMDAAGVQTVVNLDGGWGDRLKETLAALDEAHPGRFLTFALVNFNGIDEEGWSARETAQLEAGFKSGAKGLKFHKSFGLTAKYKSGQLVPIDDPKLDPIWELCAKYKRPVIIHVADPAAFFTPLDRFNERWHELNQNPGWLFADRARFPKREVILDQLHRTIEKHPQTTFINTHFGNNAEDLGSVAEKLDKYPNMYVDFDARISELGRQPFTARKFFLKYQDRIMFGTDTTPRRDAYEIYYRFLETEDEYFNCAASHHLQGFWNIYGINLPPTVLDKIYRKNAERILYGLKPNPQRPGPPEMTVARTDDFEVTGKGNNPAWNKAPWQSLRSRTENGNARETKFKLLYSAKGLYCLAQSADEKITATMTEDFQNLWTEDCFEMFLWPDERDTIYFEYEISPLNRELPILCPSMESRQYGWRPWHYEGSRKVRKATSATGGELKSGANVTGWTAEFFVPYELLTPLRNTHPKTGTRWRANFYRMDYDSGKPEAWDWSRVGPSFHEFQKFGTLVFE